MTGAVLVTGASGFIGSHTATALHAAEWIVTGVDLRAPRQPVDWEVLTCSADDKAVLARIRDKEFAAVVHNAAITDTLAPNDSRLRRANVDMPLQIARACVVSGTRLVYASSGSVYGVVPQGHYSHETDRLGPLNPYAQSKLAMERELARRAAVLGLNCVGLRYTNVFGPGEETKGPMASILSQILTAAAAGRPVRLFDDSLSATRDYLPVQVLADRVTRLLGAPGITGIYNLGSGVPVRFETLLRWCTEWGAAPVAIESIPNPVRDHYQYWTCADTRALHAVLTGLEPVTVDQIRAYAHELWARASPPAPTARALSPATGG
ncbi:NAD-dependent epimerase/dehydratase family protein [Nocardia otitidiscaviarum]|uniref:NAD-dependent epimerase/dehydratase family protein n=1 Tax=Nocardia otitidiscaviarum TaxID=1823 RepID=UPI0004A7870C|nr:NAD-dependent epimerase/dehydratase family protein [Nocardia otitidiscaviarum]MBF6137772.1 NAD-dependent epimerase/dehydratase family protein [Nocardia otitidiscaviarum]MBF6485293.1 NAD-dependent epimerase/dehydratase family protein [Nocardia otitidiscaviarum]